MTAQREEHVAAAGGEIERAFRPLLSHRPRQPPAPVKIGAAAEDVVEQVVARRDAPEHGRDRSRRLVREGAGRIGR